MQFFISHSCRNTPWVELVCKRIQAQGFAAYLAEHDQQAGRFLNDKIQQAIRDSGAVVVVLTENAWNAPLVRDEIGFASALDKLIIPLVTPQVAANPRVLGMLEGIEYVVFDLDDPTEGLLALTDRVNKLAAERQAQLLEQTQQELVNARQDQLRAERQRDIALMLVLVGALAAVLVLNQS